MKVLWSSRIRKASSTGFLLVFSGGGKWLVNAFSLSPEWIETVGLPSSSSSFRYLILPPCSLLHLSIYGLNGCRVLLVLICFSLLSVAAPGYILRINELRHWILVCSSRQVMYIYIVYVSYSLLPLNEYGYCLHFRWQRWMQLLR